MNLSSDWIPIEQAARDLQLPVRFLKQLCEKKDEYGTVLPSRLVDGQCLVNSQVMWMLESDIYEHHRWAVEEAIKTRNAQMSGCQIHVFDGKCDPRTLSAEEVFEAELYLLEDPALPKLYPDLAADIQQPAQ